MEARQAIQAGDIVFTDQVQSPVLVKRGEVITVTSQSGGIRVRTTARALQDRSHGRAGASRIARRRKSGTTPASSGLRKAAIVTIAHASFSATSPSTVETARRYDVQTR